MLFRSLIGGALGRLNLSGGIGRAARDRVFARFESHRKRELAPGVLPEVRPDEGRFLPAVAAVRGHLDATHRVGASERSEEHTSELQSLMRNSYAVFCLNKKNPNT